MSAEQQRGCPGIHSGVAGLGLREKDAMQISEKVCLLKQPVGGWWEEKVDLTPCNRATPKESSIREIRTCGSMRGRMSKDLLLLCEVGAYKRNLYIM